MKKYICIHGHFYQPPRENAWTEEIELQPSAGAPYHDWNERINIECYRSNANARVLDSQKLIKRISNNYEHISFNFGPTLLSWLEKFDSDTYHKIIAADKKSVIERGHGNALAQVYNHIIQPLANARDNETQIVWGLRDFEARYGRKAEGIWLAETAADTVTLEILADQGVKFTVLSPNQVKAVRPTADAEWQGKDYHSIDTRRAYKCNLPSGKTIDLFFYDGNTAKDVAFNKLLNSGQVFADRLLQPIDAKNQLVHIATDGESYGHHHKFGEMAMAYAIEYLDKKNDVELTNYGSFLEKFPPTLEAQIHENSSWSCAHGVERWRSDCGCHTGGQAGWNQQWRAPLRDSFDWLREELTALFEKEGKPLLNNVWEARNNFIEVLLHRSNIDSFLEKNQSKPLSESEKTKVLQLFEMQKLCMFMYTSCGWFFNEVSGIETIQILQYADKAMHYASYFSDKDFEKGFLEKLEATPSNIHENTKVIFEKTVIPKRMSEQSITWNILMQAIPSNAASGTFFAHDYELENVALNEEGANRLWTGIIRLKTTQTLKSTSYRFHFWLEKLENIKGRVLPLSEIGETKELEGANEATFEELQAELKDDASTPKIFLESDAFAEVTQSFFRKMGGRETSKMVQNLENLNKFNQKTGRKSDEFATMVQSLVFYKKFSKLLATNLTRIPEVVNFLEFEARPGKDFPNKKTLLKELDKFLSTQIHELRENHDFLPHVIRFLELVDKFDLPVNWYHAQNKLLELEGLRFYPHQRDNIIRLYSKLGVVYPFPLVAMV